MAAINFILYLITYFIYFKPYKNVELNFKAYILSDSYALPLKNDTEAYGVFNFSEGGDSYSDMYQKLKYLIKNSKVEKILITADDHSLSPYRETKNNLDRSSFFLSRSDFSSANEFIKTYFKRYFIFASPKSRDIIKLYLQSKIANLFFHSKKKPLEWVSFSKIEKESQILERFNYQYKYEKPSKALTASINKIISLCKKNKIDIIGIKYPLSKDYFVFKKDKSYHADDIFLANNLWVSNCQKFFINNDNYFLDADHLNSTGAKHLLKYFPTILRGKGKDEDLVNNTNEGHSRF